MRSHFLVYRWKGIARQTIYWEIICCRIPQMNTARLFCSAYVNDDLGKRWYLDILGMRFILGRAMFYTKRRNSA